MRNVLTARLRYGARRYLGTLVVLLIAVAFGTLVVEEPFEGAFAGSLAAVAGIVTLTTDLVVETKERRQTLHALLPTRPLGVAAARILGALVVQSGLTVVATLVLVAIGPLDGGGRPELVPLLVGHGAALCLIFASYLSEELNILLYRRRVALFVLNAIGFGVVFFLSLRVGVLESWKGASLGFALRIELVVSLLALVFLALYPRRSSHLIGISPLTGLPRAWSGD